MEYRSYMDYSIFLVSDLKFKKKDISFFYTINIITLT